MAAFAGGLAGLPRSRPVKRRPPFVGMDFRL